jgi:hypothetical protein
LAPVTSAPPQTEADEQEVIVEQDVEVKQDERVEWTSRIVPLTQVEQEVKTVIDELIRGATGASSRGAAADAPAAQDWPLQVTEGGDTDLFSTAVPTTSMPQASTTTPPPATTLPTTAAPETSHPVLLAKAPAKDVVEKAGERVKDVTVGESTDRVEKEVGGPPVRATDHPSSHFRPANWTEEGEEEFFPMPKSNLMPKDNLGLMAAGPQKPLPKRLEHQTHQTALWSLLPCHFTTLY